MKQTTKNICYKTLPEKELDDISFRRRRESTRGLKVSGRQMADIPDAEVADPEVGNGPTTGNRGCIRAVHGIVVIYQVEGGEGGMERIAEEGRINVESSNSRVPGKEGAQHGIKWRSTFSPRLPPLRKFYSR